MKVAHIVLAAVLSLLPFGGCALVRLTHPEEPTVAEPLTVSTVAAVGSIDIHIDEHGIPHIFAETDVDVVFGLGFMHARDRLAQIDIMRHASQGRLTEIFGEDFLDTDRQLRLLTFRLDDEVSVLSNRDRDLIEMYCAGLNRGMEHAPTPFDVMLSRHDVEPFTVRDVLGLVRLQAWGLSGNLDEELARAHIKARLPEGDARARLLLASVPSGGVAIVNPAPLSTTEDDDSVPHVQPPLTTPTAPLEVAPTGLSPSTMLFDSFDDAKQLLRSDPLKNVHRLFSEDLAERGASNSWVIPSSMTKTGNAMLVNDPHLAHRAPSIFYLAHLETPAFTVVGATFPGLPAVVIGHTRSLAWGMTTSYADTQDLVEIYSDPGSRAHYLVDGRRLRFREFIQRYKNRNGDVIDTEEWRTTTFGPLLPRGYSHVVPTGKSFALMWAGFDVRVGGTDFTGFFDFYRATTIDEARAALNLIRAPSQNVTLAFSDGTIGYHLLGQIPRRKSAASIAFPRDGKSSDAGWNGYLLDREKPSVTFFSTTMPSSGDTNEGADTGNIRFLVTANQRIVDDDSIHIRTVGSDAATPHRAKRIHSVLSEILAHDEKPSLETLLKVQHDVVSLEGRELAPIIGRACPKVVEGFDNDVVVAFCQAIRDFDGVYTIESVGALPFTWLLEFTYEEVLSAHLGDDVARQLMRSPSVLSALETAIVHDAGGELSPLFDDRRTPEREGVAGFVSRGAARALERLIDEVSDDPKLWRWGKVHRLSVGGPLAQLPVVGSIFSSESTAEAGHTKTIRAEGGTPVRHGTAFRMAVELSTPPRALMTTDLGQSGHLFHEHEDDQKKGWHDGTLLPIVTEPELVRTFPQISIRSTTTLRPGLVKPVQP